MKTTLVSSLILTSFAQMALALDLDLNVATGYDDNPLKLSDSFSPDGAAFIETKGKITQNFDQFRLRAGFKNRSYESNVDDADNTTWFTGIRYVERYKLLGKKARSQASIEYKAKSKTYVSRNTGQIGTFGGRTIEDRYNYSEWDLKTKTKLKLNKSVATTFKIDVNDRDYEDYSISGLSDFDFLQWGIANEWAYSIDKGHDIYTELSCVNRRFDDKRQRNLDGSIIGSSDLVYRTYGIELGYAYQIDKKWEFEIASNYESREDNGPGYYDQTNKEIKLNLAFSPVKSLESKLTLGWQDKKYINSPAFDPENDGEPSKDGYYLKVKAEKALSKKLGDSRLFMSLRYEDYDSSQANYIYDRLQSQIGVSMSF